MSTPHNEAEAGSFAETVLMPGDPLRAKWIAETFLEDSRLINNLRGIQGHTGTWKGKPVSVMASGMGMPSIGIYSRELFREYGVKTILRVGSAGSLQPDVHVRDIVLGMGACTDSNFVHTYCLPGTFAPIADFELLRVAAEEAEKRAARVHVGNLLSTDVFYDEDETAVSAWSKMGVLAVEMETAALYSIAAREKCRALAICTVSDHLLLKEAISGEERQTGFSEMILLALDIAARIG